VGRRVLGNSDAAPICADQDELVEFERSAPFGHANTHRENVALVTGLARKTEQTRFIRLASVITV
jgi:hypothetical protein